MLLFSTLKPFHISFTRMGCASSVDSVDMTIVLVCVVVDSSLLFGLCLFDVCFQNENNSLRLDVTTGAEVEAKHNVISSLPVSFFIYLFIMLLFPFSPFSSFNFNYVFPCCCCCCFHSFF